MEDEGDYECSADNGVASIKRRIRIKVNGKKYKICNF